MTTTSKTNKAQKVNHIPASFSCFACGDVIHSTGSLTFCKCKKISVEQQEGGRPQASTCATFLKNDLDYQIGYK